MLLLFLYWSIMIVAYFIASKLRVVADKFSFVQKVMMAVVYVLVFIIGVRMGANEDVMSSLMEIGLQALVITIFTVAGSMLAIFAVRKFLKIDRYGSPVSAEVIEDEETSLTKIDKYKSIRNTLMIMIWILVGICMGRAVMHNYATDILPTIYRISDISSIVFLCILLALVGFDLGLSGNVVANIKAVGAKALVFPLAAVLGTLIMGVISGLLFGFSIKEGLAISAGFGWYTYAPLVIAGAGPQYAAASAVSFMHNVIRETGAIVLIPFFAKKFGYLEVTGMAGVAAMDVCMPIVERSCRTDTVVYSFATGLLMCITTSILVPLVMGL